VIQLLIAQSVFARAVMDTIIWVFQFIHAADSATLAILDDLMFAQVDRIHHCLSVVSP
jgi:hypothetical protein